MIVAAAPKISSRTWHRLSPICL